MYEKTYIVTFDSHNNEWSFLWNHTIRRINQIAIKIELISMILPTFAVTINDDDLDILQNIDGISSIEENMVCNL